MNIEKAVEWTIKTKLKPEKILTEKFVKDLHKRMYGVVWKWAGEFRMMADIIMDPIFGNVIYSWNQSNTVKASETRNKYLKSLREADNGNFISLIEFAKN